MRVPAGPVTLQADRDIDLVKCGMRPQFVASSDLYGCPIAWMQNKDLALSNRNLVLVVDDDSSTLKGLKRLLREYGYDSKLFQSARAFQNHSDFEQAICIVLDVHLNGDSGIDLRHQLNQAGISLPVIYITANDNHATRMAAMESGCIAYLTKPFSAKSLIEPIKRAAAGLA